VLIAVHVKTPDDSARVRALFGRERAEHVWSGVELGPEHGIPGSRNGFPAREANG
jgi:hypothetical protein